MVASARLAAGLSGLRNRNTRVTNKTQLRVVRGCIEGDPIILDDDDDEKNRILASQGVDEEDANEHHLQAALFASSQRTLSTAQIKPTVATDSSAFIPTPDAAGLVADYDNLYPPTKYKDPATHLRFSDSLDECCIAGLTGSFTYFLDERDADWLERNNGAARGEGTSASAGANGAANPNGVNGQAASNGAPTPRTPHSRSAKARGKEPEHHPPPNVTAQPSIAIDEDQFELIIGLFEKWTDETVSPYLHLAPDPEHFPVFDSYYNSFAAPLHPSTFSNFVVPSNVPAPEKMVQIAKAIYPWWKERRMERKGRRVVPQLDVLIIETQEKEDKTGGSPYTCFRKRDAKPVRKTRTNNVTHTEKLTRLRGELQTSLELAQMVMQRERLKQEAADVAREVWKGRESLAEYMKLLNAAAPGSVPPADEMLLFDKERKRPLRPSGNRPLDDAKSGRITLTTNRRPTRSAFSDLDPHSPLTLPLNGDTGLALAFEQCQKRPAARMAGVQREVDKELARARRDDAYWEDLVDMPYQTMPTSGPEKLFKPLSSFSDAVPSSTPSSTPHATRTPRSLRLRTGRGGRIHLDRRLHTPQPHRLLQREWAGYPPRADERIAAQEEAERWAARSWRPRGTEVRLGRKERELGEEYWARPSVYEWERENEMQLVPDGMQEQKGTPRDPTIGFEQSAYGWEARELWARARASRDEEGWKPTPFLAVDPESLGVEVATKNAAERERMVEAWRGRTDDAATGRTTDTSSGCGGALALFMDGDAAEDGLREEMRDEEMEDGVDFWTADGRAAEAMERSWRVDERWRYDSESGGMHGQEADDRFLLDDYQPKFLRTTITLLDEQDHEAIRTDPQLLTPKPSKQDRFLDHQLRMQHPGLPQPSGSATPATPHHPTPPRQIPIPSRSSLPSPSPAPVPNGVHTQDPSLALSCSPPPPTQSLVSHPAVNGNGNSLSASASTANPARPGAVSPPKPNGTVPPSGARLPPDSAGTMRASTPMRTKQAPNGIPLSQVGLPVSFPNGTANGTGLGDVTTNMPFQPHVAHPYPSLKSALGRVVGPQQDLQQHGRPYQMPVPGMNGLNGADPLAMNVSLGVGNLQLKLPAQRAAQMRANGTGENHGENKSEAPQTRQGADHYPSTHAQHLPVPRLPSNGTRTA